MRVFTWLEMFVLVATGLALGLSIGMDVSATFARQSGSWNLADRLNDIGIGCKVAVLIGCLGYWQTRRYVVRKRDD